MTDQAVPKLVKWPFVLGDLLLLGLAAWIVFQQPAPLATWPLVLLAMCVAVGAWIGVTPFLVEYRAAIQFAESGSLTTTVAQLKNLQAFTNQVSFATAQWQVVQEQSSKTVTAAKEIAERMTKEAQAFGDFMRNANDSEKAHLRLEAEKLRRGEGDWLQVTVRLLDHVYALYQAGVRSGQPALVEQLANFQNACRDSARRLGLTAFEAQPDEPFNEKAHQLIEAEAKPPAGAVIAETLATGYTFQGQLLRPPLVRLKGPLEPEAEPEPSTQLLLDGNS